MGAQTRRHEEKKLSTEITIDRIEGKRAVLEVGKELIEWPAEALPDGAVEGSVLSFVVAGPTDLQPSSARLQRLRRRSNVGTDIDL